MDTGRQ